MFRIAEEPLHPESLKDELRDFGAGALVTFEGWVRDTNEGKPVRELAYEAYAAMAEKEGARIIQEATQRFGLLHAACVHRVGTLALGNVAVWVGVSTPHRGEAFQACRYIIDEVKHRVPIWKKEFYTDGDTGWVNCERCAAHAHDHAPVPDITEDLFYSRQTRLASVGTQGQDRLRKSKVLIIGAGGLGCPAATYLAAAGIGTLGLCDGDIIDASNLHRQPLFTPADAGKPKAYVAAERLRAQNPFITVEVHGDRLHADNAEDLFSAYDLVLDCTDNFEAKFLINDVALITQTPAIFASIYQYEGQLQLVHPSNGTACMRCVWPEMPEPGCVGSCADVGVLGAVPGVLGAMQAMEAMKHLLDLPGALGDATAFYDLLSHRVMRVRATPRGGDGSRCLCAERVSIESHRKIDLEVTAEKATQMRSQGALLIDIREAPELVEDPSDGHVDIHHPMSARDTWAETLDPSKTYVLMCAKGMRSKHTAEALRKKGLDHIYSLSGGLPALLVHAEAKR